MNILLKLLTREHQNRSSKKLPKVKLKDKKSVRWQLANKGFFSRLPIHEKNKPVEDILILFRGVLDRCLYDMTSDDIDEREDVYEAFQKDNEYFHTICLLAGFMNANYVLEVTEYLMKNIFPDYWQEYTCWKK